MAETNKIAMDLPIYENVIEYVSFHKPNFDKYYKRLSDISDFFEEINENKQDEVFPYLEKQMIKISNMLNDYYRFVNKMYDSFQTIGEELKGLDDTVYISLTAQEKYYIREVDYRGGEM